MVIGVAGQLGAVVHQTAKIPGIELARIQPHFLVELIVLETLRRRILHFVMEMTVVQVLSLQNYFATRNLSF